MKILPHPQPRHQSGQLFLPRRRSSNQALRSNFVFVKTRLLQLSRFLLLCPPPGSISAPSLLCLAKKALPFPSIGKIKVTSLGGRQIEEVTCVEQLLGSSAEGLRGAKSWRLLLTVRPPLPIHHEASSRRPPLAQHEGSNSFGSSRAAGGLTEINDDLTKRTITAVIDFFGASSSSAGLVKRLA